MGESGVDFGAGGRVGALLEAEGEDGVFEGAGAVEAPVVLGDGLGERGFESANGSERPADVVTVLFGRRLGLLEYG